MKKKNVLLSVVGTSPAVLTETVWALAHQRKPVLLDEIHVITTSKGAGKLKDALFGQDNAWDRLVAALGSEGIKTEGRYLFGPTPESILIPASSDKRHILDDIATSSDNAESADFFLRELRKFTENPATRVYASIAGGRKTMSALLFSCMSLLGRADDHVLHVLVNPPFDGPLDPPFIFPEKGLSHKQKSLDGKSVSVKSTSAEIELIDLPFVKMRGWYQDKFKEQPPSYSQLVDAVQDVAPEAKPIAPELAIDLKAGDIYVDGIKAKLAPWEFMVMACKLLVVPEIDLFEACHTAQCHADIFSGWEGDFKASRRISSWKHDDDLKGEFSKVCSAAKKKLCDIPSIAPWIASLFPHGVKKPAKYPEERISADIKYFREHFGLL